MDAAYIDYREIRIQENRKRRMKIVRRQRFALAVIAAIIIASIAFFAMTFISQAHPEESRYKYYTVVTVHGGDTLEAIAGRYISDEYKSLDTYIDEVCGINHLTDKDHITAGECIVVPYYSE